MIYVECKPDELLVRQVTNLPRRQVIHEAKGKGGVFNRLMRYRNLVAMVDEDPGATQPTYMRHLSLNQDMANLGLRLYFDSSRNHRVVVLCPRLEEWLLRAAGDLEFDMERTYRLPSRGKRTP